MKITKFFTLLCAVATLFAACEPDSGNEIITPTGDVTLAADKYVATIGEAVTFTVTDSTGANVTAAAKVFNYKRREFRLKNGARSSANMSLGQIRECLEILADADTRLKSTALDERRILEELMLRLMLIS